MIFLNSEENSSDKLVDVTASSKNSDRRRPYYSKERMKKKDSWKFSISIKKLREDCKFIIKRFNRFFFDYSTIKCLSKIGEEIYFRSKYVLSALNIKHSRIRKWNYYLRAILCLLNRIQVWKKVWNQENNLFERKRPYLLVIAWHIVKK